MIRSLLGDGACRYERKVFISDTTREEVEGMVRLHPAFFSEIYERRYVNNIYFDSYDLKNYVANVDGSDGRIKVRIRWYGDLFGEAARAVLEFKLKAGMLSRKISVPLGRLRIDESLDFEKLKKRVAKSEAPELLQLECMSLSPVLCNRYSRKYFLSGDSRYRITIDSDLAF